jgi:hypothetical protein
VDKYGAVVSDNDPVLCVEAPRVVDGSGRDKDGSGPAEEKITASSARIGPTTASAIPASALEVLASDEAIVGVALVTCVHQLTGNGALKVFAKSNSLVVLNLSI